MAEQESSIIKLTPEEKYFFSTPYEKLAKDFQGLISFQIPDQISNQIIDASLNGRRVVFIASHQGYFDVEFWAWYSEMLVEKSEGKFPGIDLPFDLPATSINVGQFLAQRQKYYDQSHLYLVAENREENTKKERYKKFVEENKDKIIERCKEATAKVTRNLICKKPIIMLPEISIESGRTKNPETGEKIGMIEPSENKKMNRSLKHFLREKENLILPVSIHGSYKVVSSDDNKLNPRLLDYIQQKEKLVTVKTLGFFNLNNDKLKHLDYKGILFLINLQIAAGLPSEAQGIYRPYLNRTNLEKL